jgi:hypothetical protein
MQAQQLARAQQQLGFSRVAALLLAVVSTGTRVLATPMATIKRPSYQVPRTLMPRLPSPSLAVTAGSNISGGAPMARRRLQKATMPRMTKPDLHKAIPYLRNPHMLTKKAMKNVKGFG